MIEQFSPRNLCDLCGNLAGNHSAATRPYRRPM
jgi:hypothetical protein